MISYIIIYAFKVHLMSGQAMQWSRKQIESRGGGLDIRNHAKQKIKRIMAMVMFKFAKMWGEGV